MTGVPQPMNRPKGTNVAINPHCAAVCYLYLGLSR